DFSNEALLASEKGLKRLWDAYEHLQKFPLLPNETAGDADLDRKVNSLLNEFEGFMNDDFGTARVMANIFELVPVINSIKDKNIPALSLSGKTMDHLKMKMKVWVEDIFGLKSVTEADNEKLQGVMQLLIEIRKEARSKKDLDRKS